MVQSLQSGQSGRDFYADKYRTTLEKEAEWLRRTAGSKADSVAVLLSRNGIAPHTILELGCGTGAVISELERRGTASEFVGVDYSEEAVEYLRNSNPRVTALVADITAVEEASSLPSADVFVLSRVLEHLEEPSDFLRAVRQIDFPYLVVEVPLEDLPIARLKSIVKDRADNAAGHVQFFTRGSLRALIQSADYEILDEVTYAPVLDRDTFNFAYGDAPPLRRAQKWVTERALPAAIGPIWTRLYHAHHAVLCKPQG